MGRQQLSTQQVSRPKRRATNAHIFRYLQTRNPSKLEENDLKKALEASLEECPDFWPEDSASCSEQSNATSASSQSSLLSGNNRSTLSRCLTGSSSKRSRAKKSATSSQLNHLYGNPSNHNHHNHHSHMNSLFSNSNCCPMSVHKRYKPVAKKNIYNEADFFHDGIMEYIEYELNTLAESKNTWNLQCMAGDSFQDFSSKLK